MPKTMLSNGDDCGPPEAVVEERCAECDEPTDNPCSACDQCEECCTCTRCERCAEPVEAVCSRCDRCDDCCRCVHCTSCNEPSDTTCSHCECCEGCCECVHCADCGDPSDSTCSRCDRCEGCCECHTCPECRTGHDRYGCDDFCHDCEHCEDHCECGDSHGRDEVLIAPPSTPKFHPAPRRVEWGPLVSGRCLSVEIETASLNYDQADRLQSAVRRWRGSIVEDGSIQGVEVVTAPAGGIHLERQIREICTGLAEADATVNATCGLHVHIDARDLRWYDLRRLVILYAAVEPALFDLAPASRRTSGFCMPCGTRLIEGLATARCRGKSKTALITNTYGAPPDRSFPRKKTHKYDSARYSALNLHSYIYRGSVEFRLGSGSVDPTKILRWCRVLLAVFEASQRATEAECWSHYAAVGAEALSAWHQRFAVNAASQAARRNAWRILPKILVDPQLIAWASARRARLHPDAPGLDVAAVAESPDTESEASDGV